MRYFITKSKTPLEWSILFLIGLSFSYIFYHFFIYNYYKLILILSSSIVADIFDMKVLNSIDYLQSIKLVSNSTMQNISTHEISRVGIEFIKMDIDKIFDIFTKTPLILTFILLFAKNIKTFLISLSIMITIQVLSTVIIMTDIILFTSFTSLKLMNYFQMFGITQFVVELLDFMALLSKAYIPIFIPLVIAYGLWESEAHSFKIVVEEEKKVDKILLPILGLLRDTK